MLVADLAPKAQHPCQLQQAIQAYNYCSHNEDGGRELSPKNVRAHFATLAMAY
jgi:hypothetical protein